MSEGRKIKQKEQKEQNKTIKNCELCENGPGTIFYTDFIGSKWLICSECKGMDDLMCSKCGNIIKSPDLIRRRDYFGYPNLCDGCYDEIIKKNKQEYKNINFMELFKEFKTKNKRWKNTVILNNNKFKKFYEYLSENRDPIKWASAIFGLEHKKVPIASKWIYDIFGLENKNNPIMFSSEQANQLIELINKEKGDVQPRFIHAISSAILDIFSVSHKNDNFKFYVDNKVPSRETILDIWTTKITSLSYCGNIIYDTCSICHDGVLGHEKMLVCCHCGVVSHLNCKFRRLMNDLSCEKCLVKYTDVLSLKMFNNTSVSSKGTHNSWISELEKFRKLNS